MNGLRLAWLYVALCSLAPAASADDTPKNPKDRVWVSERYRKANWKPGTRPLRAESVSWYTSAPEREVRAAPGQLVLGVAPIGRSILDVYRVVSVEGNTATLENRSGRLKGVPGIFVHPLIGVAKRVEGSVSQGTPVLHVKGPGYYRGFQIVVVARTQGGVPCTYKTAWEGKKELDPLDGVALPLPPSGPFSRVSFPKTEEYGLPVGMILAQHGKTVWVWRRAASGASEVLIKQTKNLRQLEETSNYKRGDWVWRKSHGKWRSEQIKKVVKLGYYKVGDSSNPRGWDEVFATHPRTGARPGPKKKSSKGKKR